MGVGEEESNHSCTNMPMPYHMINTNYITDKVNSEIKRTEIYESSRSPSTIIKRYVQLVWISFLKKHFKDIKRTATLLMMSI